jgi:hypothetical protein
MTHDPSKTVRTVGLMRMLAPSGTDVVVALLDQWRGDALGKLFDQSADPRELRDLARLPEHAAALATQRARLIEALADAEEGFVAEGALVVGRPVQPVLRWLREAARAPVAGVGPPSDGEG